jgi:N-acetylglucosaminyldiphosphoundecaprenol N-acetyl-beta-D-mannosaminyltransferase
MQYVNIFGVKITNVSEAEALSAIDQLVTSKDAAVLYFVNAHTLNFAAREPDFRKTLNRGNVVFGDGTGVRWAARLRGVYMKANLNGTDLLPRYISSRPGVRYFLLGSTEATLVETAEAFRRLFPKAELVGTHHGYLNAETEQSVIAAINAKAPDILLVGMGNPLQERWIETHRKRLDVKLAAGVGGLLEYLAGTRDRAPAWMRRAGIEWLHILVFQPWKAGRYLLGMPAFLARMVVSLPEDRRRTHTPHSHGSFVDV